MSKQVNNATDGAEQAQSLADAAEAASDKPEAEVVEPVEPETAETVEEEETPEEDDKEEPEEETDSDAKEEEETSEEEDAEVSKWKHHARQNENKLKSALTKLEKANEENAALRLEKDKYEVAFTKGLDAEAVELLEGNTRAEIEAKADKLLKLLSAKAGSGFGYNPLAGRESGDEKPTDNTPVGILEAMNASGGLSI